MRADFAGLFEDIDAFGGKLGFGARFVMLADQSSQMQGASKSGGPGADDQHVRVQPLAFGAHGSILARKLANGRASNVSVLNRQGCCRGYFFSRSFGEGGDELEDVADDAVVGDFEDGRVLSLLMATMVREPFMPTTCWMAPLMPSAR